MQTNVVQLHDYSGVVVDKENGSMMLMWCRTSNIIMDGRSRTHPVHMFVHKNIDDVLPNLLAAGWRVSERFEQVDVTEG